MAFFSRTFSGRFWALVLATFLGFLGIGTVLPMLAPHVRYKLHGTDQDVGFVVGVFSFVALAGRLVSGPLADRRGRKISFLTGLFCCGLAGRHTCCRWALRARIWAAFCRDSGKRACIPARRHGRWKSPASSAADAR